MRVMVIAVLFKRFISPLFNFSFENSRVNHRLIECAMTVAE
jgi:hypothetical protein